MFYEIYYQTLETRKIRLSTLTMKFPIQAIQEYYYITHFKYNIKKIFSRSYLEPELLEVDLATCCGVCV